MEIYYQYRSDLRDLKQGLTHNDLHMGNWLVNNTGGLEGKEGRLIDWEFAGCNYFAYDWANLANEMDMELQQQEYQWHPNPLTNPLMLLVSTDEDPVITTALFRRLRSLSHLFWGCWALDQTVTTTKSSIHLNDIEFDYQTYAQLRFNLFSQFSQGD